MRTNIEIDDKLMEDAMKLSGLKSKKEIVNTALNEYVKFARRQSLKNLQGKVE